MSTNSSQRFESYVPVYDAIPDKWDDAQQFLTETLRKVTESLNVKEIGYYIDDEVLSGKQYTGMSTTPQQYRDIFRKAIDTGAIAAGANSLAHGITFDSMFQLIDMWIAGTDSAGQLASIITDANATMDATNVTFTSPRAYDKGTLVIEYLKES